MSVALSQRLLTLRNKKKAKKKDIKLLGVIFYRGDLERGKKNEYQFFFLGPYTAASTIITSGVFKDCLWLGRMGIFSISRKTLDVIFDSPLYSQLVLALPKDVTHLELPSLNEL